MREYLLLFAVYTDIKSGATHLNIWQFRACNFFGHPVLLLLFAGMAELADALASGASDCKIVQVQVLFSAPKQEASDGIPSEVFLYRIGAFSHDKIG